MLIILHLLLIKIWLDNSTFFLMFFIRFSAQFDINIIPFVRLIATWHCDCHACHKGNDFDLLKTF